MKLKHTLIMFLLFTFCKLYAQTSHDHEGHNEKHEHHEHNHDNEEDNEKGHHHKANEIGFAYSPVYFVKGKEFTSGIHLHYIYNISKFGVGLGYEGLFDDHEHKTFGIIAMYRPIERLGLCIAPGIATEHQEEHDGEHHEGHHEEFHFALHAEVIYEYEINNTHIGPLLELAYDEKDYHMGM